MYTYYIKAGNLKHIKKEIKNNPESDHPAVTTVNIWYVSFWCFLPLKDKFH